MFNFVLDVKKFKKMEQFCGETIDIIAYRGQVLLVSESGISYAHHITDSSFISPESDTEPGEAVRISKDIFCRLAISGMVQVDKFESTSTISFYGSNTKKPKYTVTIPNQLSLARYREMLKFIDDKENYNKINLKDSEDIVNLANRLNTDIMSLNGYMFMYIKSSYIYKKFNSVAFSCIAKYLYKALDISYEAYLITKYLVFCDEKSQLYVALDKNVTPKGNSLNGVVGTKSKYRFSVNLENLITAVKSLSGDTFDIELDLGMGETKVSLDSTKFTIDTPASRIESTREKRMSLVEKLNAKVRTDFRVKIPYWVLPILGRGKDLDLFIKPTCMVFKAGEICIMVGGALLDV